MHTFLKAVLGAFGFVAFAMVGLAGWVAQSSEPVHASPAAVAPSFKFRNLKSGMSLADAKTVKAVQKCVEYERQTTCDLADNDADHLSGSVYPFLSIAGAPTSGSGVYFDGNGVFSGLDVFTYQHSFAEISDALTSAYGETCRFNVKQLHNAFNAQYLSIEATWCFDGGALTFVERSSDDLRSSVLSYAVDRPPQAPRKFTPAEL